MIEVFCPSAYKFFDKCGIIYKSFKTESSKLARARGDALVDADDEYWLSGIVNGDVDKEGASGTYATTQNAQWRIFSHGHISE